MALYPCPECKREISTDARACPHCGKPIEVTVESIRARGMPEASRKQLQNLLFGILSIVIFILALRACGSESNKLTPTAAAPAAQETKSVSESSPKKATGALLLAGKSELDVALGLGNPVSREKTKYGPKLTYALGSGATIEVVYINGKADWITMTPKPGKAVPFTAAAIVGIGLDPARPAFASPQLMRWENIQGLRQVSIHLGEGNTVGYYYVKARTE